MKGKRTSEIKRRRRRRHSTQSQAAAASPPHCAESNDSRCGSSSSDDDSSVGAGAAHRALWRDIDRASAQRDLPRPKPLLQPDAMVFEGGGVLGLAYADAIAVAERGQHMRNVRRFAGASAGAITAAALAAGADAGYIDRVLGNLDLRSMMDTQFGLVRNAWRLWTKGGVARGAALHQWMGKVLWDLTGDADVTFGELQGGRELVVVTTSMSARQPRYFSTQTNPDLPVRQAVSASAAYPLVFPMVSIGREQHWDGGILDNYPLHVFDRPLVRDLDNENQHAVLPSPNARLREPNPGGTVGFKLLLDSEVQPPASYRVRHVADAARGLIDCWHDAALRVHVDERIDWPRTVRIKVGAGISSMSFDLSDEQKQRLRKAGADAAQAFFAKAEQLAA